jgi:phosphate transport system permease protein
MFELVQSRRDFDDVPRLIYTERGRGDQAFRVLTRMAAALVLVLMGLIFVFLLTRGWSAFHRAGLGFFTRAQWEPEGGTFGISAALLGTVLIAGIAIVIAVPVSIGAALFLTEYAPRRARRPLNSLVDLLAAIPSLIFGLWARATLMPRAVNVARWLTTHFGFVPLLHTKTAVYTTSTFIAGIVVAIMIVPICTAVMREAFSQAPVAEKEGAYALGSTKWGMVRTVVIPFGKGGIIGGSMLGLGRALGETIAVTLIISPTFDLHTLLRPLESGGNSIASMIALKWTESGDFGQSALIAAGLVLFVMTLGVNAFASMIVQRSRSGAATEL